MEIIKTMLCKDILEGIITKKKRKNRLPKIGGVYKIVNINNNKIYIGSSKDIYHRWKEHIIALNKNNHHSLHLQNSWNKYGANIFKCEIIEIINKTGFLEDKSFDNELRKREQFYLDYYKSYNRNKGYNINKKAQGGRSSYTFEDLHNGKCPFTEEQFFYIMEQIQDPYIGITDLAKELNIKSYIIYNLTNNIYPLLTQEYYIPKRKFHKESELDEELKRISEQFQTET